MVRAVNRYEAIVIGTGAVGSATLSELARRGVRAIGLDRFPPGHDRGSSHGATRMIRQAYFEHPDYVPLVLRAFDLWGQLEARRGRRLYHEVGLLQVGPADGHVLQGVTASAKQHGLHIESLTAEETRQRFAGLLVPESMEALFETRAGYLEVENCIVTMAEEAVEAGAELQIGGAVRSWRVEGAGVVVETDTATFLGDRLIITAGAWAGQLLADLPVTFEIRRKPLYWYKTESTDYMATAGCPAFLFETDDGVFYGFPQVDADGIKLAEHSGGSVVADPSYIDRDLDGHDKNRVEAFAERYLLHVSKDLVRHATCMYTMTPDEHFIVDRDAQHPHVAFAAGLSGHGFKFAPVLAEALADLVLEGRTDLPIGFLAADRFRPSR